ncbi:HEAT repeat domain-containing protein [Candidatus Omnitrophota bacterium]
MLKKLLTALFAVMLIGTIQVTQVEAFVELPQFTHPKAKEHKIKRLVSQLYEKRHVVDAQRGLVFYGADATPYLIPVLEQRDNESAKVAALRVIEKTKDPAAEDAVIKSLKDRDRRVKQQAARTLSAIGTKEKSVEPLKDLLDDYSPDVRYNALRALATIAPEADTDLFIAVLGDYDPRLRMYAAYALGKIKSKKAVPYLSQMTHDVDPSVRMAVVGALARINTQDCLNPLVVMMRDPDLNVRVLAVERVGKMNAKGADKPLAREANNPDPRLASKAILALADKKSTLALQVAREHVDDEHISVRLASIEVVGRMGGREDKPLLETLLRAESSKVRKEAAKALATVNSRT